MAKIRLYNGELVDPFDLGPEDIYPEALIHQVCLINRFHGASIYPYSVGQHKLALYALVPKRLRKVAITHDLQEGIFQDLASPVKAECPEYRRAEHNAGGVIEDYFGISHDEANEFDEWDKRIYINERDALLLKVDELGMGDDREGIYVPPNTPPLFQELRWRVVRARLLNVFKHEFPDLIDKGYQYAET